jgi:hypothetical protein
VSIGYDEVAMFAAWNHRKQARATVCGSCSPPCSASAERLQRGPDLGDGPHPGAVEVGLFPIVAPVVRGEVARGDLGREVQERVEGLPRMLGEPLPAREPFHVQPLVEEEVEITTRENPGIHASSVHEVSRPRGAGRASAGRCPPPEPK